MYIQAKLDENQIDDGDRTQIAECPECGQKLFKVESLHANGLFRTKCRRCKKYIRVHVAEE